MSVVVEQVDGTLVITLDRPERANAIDQEMTDGLDAALNRLEDDHTLRAGIITGGSVRFSAGTDLADGAGSPTPRGGEYGIARRRSRVPVIAAVEGPAVGGGFEVVLACDMVIASRSAWFALPEVSRGLVASCGALFRLVQVLPRPLAVEMLVTGRRLEADEAARHGLVNRLCDPGQALEAAMELATAVAAQSPAGVSATMAALRTVIGTDDALGWTASELAVAAILAAPDHREGIRAFLHKRPPRWPAPVVDAPPGSGGTPPVSMSMDYPAGDE